MKKSFAAALAITVATGSMALSAPAYAGATSDFAGCDGLRKPKNKNDGMRGVATIPAYSGRANTPTGRLAACNRALERKELRDEQTLRKAHLLRARASYYLEVGQAEKALADLKEARATAAPEYAGKFFYDRSMGVSLDLMEAMALSALDRWDEAAPLVEKAEKGRPYALQVQRVATILKADNSQPAQGEQSPWAKLMPLDPEARAMSDRLTSRVSANRDLDFAQLRSDLEAKTSDLPALSLEMASGKGVQRLEKLTDEWARPYLDAATLAFAQAATDGPEAAVATLERVRAGLERASETTDENGETKPVPLVRALSRLIVEPRVKLAEMRIALAQGRTQEAAETISQAKLAENAFSKELYAAFDAANAERAEPLDPLPELRASKRKRGSRVNRMASSLLIIPENESGIITYKKSRTDVVRTVLNGALTMGFGLLGGAKRTSGFESEENEDGSIKVQYIGNTVSGPVVQEMTLLRAAEIALENEATHFTIDARRDYQRYMVQSMNYVETQRTLSGYKTELDIQLVPDPGALTETAAASAMEARTVIEALGPIYYEEGDAEA
ncbi:MAG: hypothetical protein WBA51_15215 [Erythrobacter sp.]